VFAISIIDKLVEIIVLFPFIILELTILNISVFVKVYPVGLFGELTAIILVFGFINASSSSKSTTHFVPSSFIYHLE